MSAVTALLRLYTVWSLGAPGEIFICSSSAGVCRNRVIANGERETTTGPTGKRIWHATRRSSDEPICQAGNHVAASGRFE